LSVVLVNISPIPFDNVQPLAPAIVITQYHCNKKDRHPPL
jgi:hypothetical protein